MKKTIAYVLLMGLLVVIKVSAFNDVQTALKLPSDMYSGATYSSKLNKTMRVKISKLKDNTGLEYLGGIISAAELAPFLAKLKDELGDKFSQYRQNQSARDHHQFHVTIINPMEYQLLSPSAISIGQALSITLNGLGRASKDGKTAYFIVVQSNDGQFYRQKLALPNKDFHITLGFDPQDVYGVSKGSDSLIK